MIIAVDFDGTIAKHLFPEIGEEVPYAFRVMKRLQKYGHKLILWTIRSDIDNQDRTPKEGIQPEGGGTYETDAVEFCRSKGIEFWGVNENPEQKSWSLSPKAYANFYIDDAALGCPLVRDVEGRPYVNWESIEWLLIKMGELPSQEEDDDNGS